MEGLSCHKFPKVSIKLKMLYENRKSASRWGIYLRIADANKLLRQRRAVDWKGAMGIDARRVILVSMGEEMKRLSLRRWCPCVHRKWKLVLCFHAHLSLVTSPYCITYDSNSGYTHFKLSINYENLLLTLSSLVLL